MKERILVPFLFKSYNYLFSRRLLSKQGHQNRSGGDARASRWGSGRLGGRPGATSAVPSLPLGSASSRLPASVSSVSWPACSRSSAPSPWLRGTVSSMPGHPKPPLTTPSAPNLPQLIQRIRALSAYSEGSQHTLRAPSMLWTFPAFRCVPGFPAIAFTGMSRSSCTHGCLRESWLWHWCGPAQGRCCLPNRGRMHPQGMAAGEGQWLSPVLTKRWAVWPPSHFCCLFELVDNKKLWKNMFFRIKIDWRYRSQFGRRYFHESNPWVVSFQTI